MAGIQEAGDIPGLYPISVSVLGGGGADTDLARKRLEDLRCRLEAENAAAAAQVAAARAKLELSSRRITELEEELAEKGRDKALAPLLETALELANTDCAAAKRERDGVIAEMAAQDATHQEEKRLRVEAEAEAKDVRCKLEVAQV